MPATLTAIFRRTYQACWAARAKEQPYAGKQFLRRKHRLTAAILQATHSEAPHYCPVAAITEHLPDLPGQMTCEAAPYGEYFYDTHIMRWLQACGAPCAHIHMLPVYHLSLPQHNSHHGSFGRGTEARRIDCRHYCSNVIDVWNQVRAPAPMDRDPRRLKQKSCLISEGMKAIDVATSTLTSGDVCITMLVMLCFQKVSRVFMQKCCEDHAMQCQVIILFQQTLKEHTLLFYTLLQAFLCTPIFERLITH